MKMLDRMVFCRYTLEVRLRKTALIGSGVFSVCAEGISQAGMLAFQFGAAREREKLAKRVSHRFKERIADL